MTFEEARARLLTGVDRLPSERAPLGQCAGRVLAEDLVANGPLPGFDHSAMDGYAVAVGDLTSDPPYALPVTGESSAGRAAPPLAPGTACRIFTGAPMPERADGVVMQEHVAREGNGIHMKSRPRRGQNVRFAGEDLARGAVAIAVGARLSAGALALVAMLDRAEIVVVRPPRVTILCTGDELRAPGSGARPATLPESNSPALAALARQAGAVVRVAPITGDDPGTLDGAIRDALDGADVLVTVGGVSVGDHDLVRPALARAGVSLDFWRVAIKPGKPLAVGRRGPTHVLGLPGNPASALVTFALFGAPLLRSLQGDAHPLPLPFPVRLAATRSRATDRLELVRATLEVTGGTVVANAHDNQSSGSSTSLASSDGVAFVPGGPEPIAAGTAVELVRWSDA